MENKEENQKALCKHIPDLLSSFVDTFVDFSVSGGLFLPSQNPSLDPQKPHQETPLSLQTRYPAPDRLIAIGDLHGDLEKSKQALRLAGLIDGSDKWAGGSATAVQVGDVLDRGDDEIKILYFLEKLKREAMKDGGNFIIMNGNHEIMNIEGDFRYVTKLGLKEFEDWAYWYCLGNEMKSLCVGLEKPKDIYNGIPLNFRGVDSEVLHGIRARIAALRPNGPIANKFLSKNVTVLVVGDSIFVHGGLLARHVEYGLERINEEVRDWISGLMGKAAPRYCRGSNAVVWLRKYSDVEKNCDCSMLEHVLATVPGVKRMIMGHTIQVDGINVACNNKAVRIDVGMSKGCGDGLPEVLEINQNSELRVLTSNPLYQSKHKSYADADTKEGLGLLSTESGSKQVINYGHSTMLLIERRRCGQTEESTRPHCCDIVEISAPKLTFLKFKGETELNFFMINLPSPKQTEVGHVVRGNRWRLNDLRMMKELWGAERWFSENLHKFFQGIRNAESVALCTSFEALAMIMDAVEGKPSPFSRLKSLKFIDSVNPWKIPAKVLNYLLSGSPCVETVLTEFRNDELCVTSPSNSGIG